MMNSNSVTPSNISPLRHHNHHNHDLAAPKPFRKTLRRSTRLLNLEQAASRKDADGDMIDVDDIDVSGLGLSGLHEHLSRTSDDDPSEGNSKTIGNNTDGTGNGTVICNTVNSSSSFSLKRPHPSSTDMRSPSTTFPRPRFPTRNTLEQHDVTSGFSLSTSTSTPTPNASTSGPQFLPPLWSNSIKRRDSFDQFFSPTSPLAIGQSTPVANSTTTNTNATYQFTSNNPYTTSPSPSPIPSSKSHHLHIQHHHPPLPRQPPSQMHRAKPKFNPSVTAELSDYHTPENYRSVKPLQTAFMSTGLLSKRNRMNNSDSQSEVLRIPPDTPCKRPSNTSLPIINHSSVFGVSSTPTSYSPNASNIGGGFGTTTSGRRRSNLGLHDSLLRFSVDFGNSSTQAAEADSPMRDEILDQHLPETPTKETSEHNTSGFMVNTSDSSTSSHFLPPISSLPMNIPNSTDMTISSSLDNSSNSTEKYPVSTTPQSRISRWTDGSSSNHTSSSPRTPDIFMHSDHSTGNDTTSMEVIHNHHSSVPMIRRTTSTTNLVTVQEPPRTPAKTPKTPIDPLMNDTSFLSLRKSAVDIDDPVLTERFDKVSLIGRGEFSIVYSLSLRGNDSVTSIPSTSHIHHSRSQSHALDHDNRFAVKRTRFPFIGPKARCRRLEEVEILRSLTNHVRPDGRNSEEEAAEEGRDYVLMLLDAWEANGYLYIMTEFCENGSLDTFLSERGNISRLDEWRVWKILVEIALVS